MKRLRNIAIGTITGVTLLVGAQPALAGVNTHIVTRSASAWFGHHGDLLKACDRRPDGWGVRAEAYRPNGEHAAEWDKFGNGCSASRFFRFFREDESVTVRVCRYKAGSNDRCSGWVRGRA